ncbi:MAG: DUF5053 domain-containing protein [Muribaculaceae bacterium]|nr:DUF5053 domain-containing protein [Muribaculaceae bacterium]
MDNKKEKEDVLHSVHVLDETDLLKVLNCSYISKRFFGKSRYWFSQKLNHNVVNGKTANFTKEELEILSSALQTISLEIDLLVDKIKDSIELS